MVSNMVPSASHPVWPLPSFSFLCFFSGVVFGENSWAPQKGKSVFPWESATLGSKGSEGDWCEQWGRGSS